MDLVQCLLGGSVIVNQNNLTVNSQDCGITNPIYKYDPFEDGATVLGPCTGKRDVGKATIVMGSVNSHAPILALTMNDKKASRSHRIPTSRRHTRLSAKSMFLPQSTSEL